jgi:biotin transport system substrate-specific component
MHKLRATLYISLFTALIIVGSYIRIPVGPVPIALASFFVLLSGLLLGWKRAAASVAMYLFLGAIGFPVFTGGGGPAQFIGPTGGYLMGYPPAAIITGVISSGNSNLKLKCTIRDVLALTAGTAVIYAAGVPWLKHVLSLTWPHAAAIGILPFLLGDGIKIAAAITVRRALIHAVPEIVPVLKK